MTFADIEEKIMRCLECTSCGSCGIFARWFTKIALAHNLTDFKIVFGWVQLRGAGGNWQDEHIWIEDTKGNKVDPTVKQFSSFVGYVKGRRKTYSPSFFIQMPQFDLRNIRSDGSNVIKCHLKSKCHRRQNANCETVSD